MSWFIEHHPVLFTILALPCVVTACTVVLAMCNVRFTYQPPRK